MLGIGLCVEIYPVQLPSHLLAERYHELLVALALVAPQVKIAMHCHHSVAQTVQDAGKAYGIGSAT